MATVTEDQHGEGDRTGRTEALPPVPDPGQVVKVRGSTWAVSDVRRQGLPRSPADEGRAGLTHVVSLQSLDEDRLGQELTVVWELEVGHTLQPDQGLPETVRPEAFDDPNKLAAFVDAVRWGAVTSADADSYQAPFRSGANVEAYQLEPLRRALKSSRTNLLLADDVGLGKTIEAGLVVQELLLRHRARTVVIVCPPSLRLKWQDEMREKFGLDFVIVDSELMAKVRRSHGLNANPFRLFPRVIVSMAWLPSLRAQRLLRDVLADVRRTSTARRFAFDVLVVDEAHHVAPASPTTAPGQRGYAVDSNRTTATKKLAEACEHRLFLSATPHNGYSESFTALLEMIDSRRFSRGASIDRKALREVRVRRLKTELPDKGFRPRELLTIPFTPSEDEQEQFDRLVGLLTEVARAKGRGKGGDIVSMLLKKRFLSSPWSFARTLDLYQGAAAGSRQPELDEDDYYTEILGSGQSDEEEGEVEHPEFTALRHSKGADPLPYDLGDTAASLVEWGMRYEHKPDSRLEALLTFLDGNCRPDGRWSNERVVVFTEYAATLDWIAGVLRQRGYGDVLETIQGSTPLEERELIRARFTERPDKHPVRVLLATDSAGEGIDLQSYCHRLVNFDIPFNPSRLEQRIGRIDRYGQTKNPEIYHFSPGTSSSTYAADMAFMEIIARKVGNASQDLGRVNQVIDAAVQQRFSPVSTPRKARPSASDDADMAETETLAGSIELNRELTELSRTYEDRKAVMHLTPANARRVVDTALDLDSQPPLAEIGDQDTDAQVFQVPPLGRSWQPALRGLDTRLEPGVPRPITFDDKAAHGRTDLVHIHLGHALMQRATRTLRSALFSVDAPVNRVTAVVTDDLPESCVAAVSRLVLVGRGGLRLHEEVFLTGIRLRGQALAEARVEQVLDETLDSGNLVLADEQVRAHLAGLWNDDDARLRTRLLNAMRRKSESRQEKVTETLKRRQETDIARAREIFGAFRINLGESRDRLEQAIRVQEEELLFTDDQQKQRRRDLHNMNERMESLDDEEAREIASIRERYSDIRPYVSAAAVVFALTTEDAKNGSVQA
ncbi:MULTISPECIES: DISARM system SNF2-like helicase DrmD [unclassified Kitasatospora]|uniref:DISARM system SNF2-like helicase DrmD n=1 Tax=Kitasatospora sp. Root107 TaxID=1736424 RepID=UPI0007111CC4|nr:MULTISPECIES: DISARM system SNF2-like helicase DrmD [unclassified Kitasatospora]KQV20866.1 DNA helicase [Kitasatospora sp. Root107]KRB60479.1 DNA helicase [Kitasatospora sp. Root187]